MMPTRSRDPATVLLVEDDPADQALTRRAFLDGKVEVDLRMAGTGEEALDYLKRTGEYESPTSSPRPDLILLDLNLPGLDGKQVLQRLRADTDLRSIPVVALTTSNQDEDIDQTYRLGANSYITKPVDIDDFVNALRALGNYWFRVVSLPTECGSR